MEMPGAVLIGDAAGTLDAARIKGIHQAMRSGMLCAEHLTAHGTVKGYDAAWRASPGGKSLQAVRNIKPGFKHGLWLGLANAALETALRGHTPWTLQHVANDRTLKVLDAADPHLPEPPLPPERTLPPRDRTAAVYLASTAHDEQQPVHLHVADTSICADRCAREYGNPCTRFCPAAVYEILTNEDGTPPAADQRGQLRALQGLRHQGSLPDHHLDHARRRVWPELPESVGEMWPRPICTERYARELRERGWHGDAAQLRGGRATGAPARGAARRARRSSGLSGDGGGASGRRAATARRAACTCGAASGRGKTWLMDLFYDSLGAHAAAPAALSPADARSARRPGHVTAHSGSAAPAGAPDGAAGEPVVHR